MSELTLRAVITGIFFGIWPLFMNKSGLPGNMSAAVFAGLAFLTVAPFAARDGVAQSFRDALPIYFILAGVMAGIGLLAFNGMLAKATPKNVGSLFITMILVQVAVPAIYHMVKNGVHEPKKLVGIALASVAAVLLT